MYRRCPSCTAKLGENDLLEDFPVGESIAFDPSRGRLWVVCRGCRRWNLVPLEERWEVVESCERLFRGSRLRTSTAEIGLAKPHGRMELIRIGDPIRHEFAAWRYGRVLTGRRLGHLVRASLTAPIVAAAEALYLLLAPYEGELRPGDPEPVDVLLRRDPREVVAVLPRDTGAHARVTRAQLGRASLLAEADGGWLLRVPCWHGEVVARDEAALKVLRRLLPLVNRQGASSRQVNDALTLIDRSESTGHLFGDAARQGRSGRFSLIAQLPVTTRLALEMVAHDELETQALQDNLHRLRGEWTEAEEIAAIADRLAEPPFISRWLDAARSRTTPRTP